MIYCNLGMNSFSHPDPVPIPISPSDPIPIPIPIPYYGSRLIHVLPKHQLPSLVGSYDTCSESLTASGTLRSLTPLPFTTTPQGYPCTPPSFRYVPISPAVAPSVAPCGWCQKPHISIIERSLSV